MIHIEPPRRQPGRRNNILQMLLGGRLKFEEMFMGRLADAIGAIFLGYGALHHYARNHATSDDGLQTVAEHALLRVDAAHLRWPGRPGCRTARAARASRS